MKSVSRLKGMTPDILGGVSGRSGGSIVSVGRLRPFATYRERHDGGIRY